jgi:hypothetical protein
MALKSIILRVESVLEVGVFTRTWRALGMGTFFVEQKCNFLCVTTKDNTMHLAGYDISLELAELQLQVGILELYISKTNYLYMLLRLDRIRLTQELKHMFNSVEICLQCTGFINNMDVIQ